MGADDKHAQREDGFNMDAVTDAVRPKKVGEQERQEALRKMKQAKRDKEMAEKRKAEKGSGGEQKHIPVGPKLGPNGQPILPTRAAQKPTTNDKNNRKEEQAPPAPPKQCCVIL